MSFNLDEFAAEIGANRSGPSAIEDMYDDAERIRDRMNSRRKLMEQQIAADEIKSKICDKIQQQKRAVPGLAQKINALEDDDPDLFKYIRNLEFINQGIWCPKCNVQKCVGTRKESPQEVPQQTQDANEIAAEYERISQNLQFAIKDVQTLKNQFEERLQQLAQAIVTLNDELDMVNREATKYGINIETRGLAVSQNLFPTSNKEGIKEHLRESMSNMYGKIPAISETIRMSDLPAKPEYDLDLEIMKKYNKIKNDTMSSDDLLGI